MNGKPTFSPLSSTARRLRDPHADLLRDTRGLRRELAAARETWLAALSIEKKEDCLFEFEMLLKALACWGNPRNHPVPWPREPLRERNFRSHLEVARQCIDRALVLCDRLIGTGKSGLGYLRYLPLGFSDESRTHDTRESLIESPADCLAALRHVLASQREVLIGLSQLVHVSWRVFHASLHPLLREVQRNTYFNPLALLEFRPEYDRIRALEVLECIQFMEHDAAHRLVALTFLAHFRLLRVLQLAQTTSLGASSEAPCAWALFSVARAEARALDTVLRRRAPSLLADAIQHNTLRVAARDLQGRFEDLVRETHRGVRLRASLDSMGASVTAEFRRAFERSFAGRALDATGLAENATMSTVCTSLRDLLMANVIGLVRALRGAAEPERVFTDRSARRAGVEKLRQSAWIFGVITRAFVSGARAARQRDADTWSTGPSLRLVRDYIAYFNVLGRSLAWETEYASAERLGLTLYGLAEVDWVDVGQLDTVIAECEAFGAWLFEVHTKLSKREELEKVPFDKQTAGEVLRAHLGRAKTETIVMA